MGFTLKQQEELFEAVRSLKRGPERQGYLESVCANAPELRRRLERLVASYERADQFFANGTAALNESLHSLSISEQPGDRVGPYKLLEKLGEGGCGVVHLAEQQVPVRRKVALKIIKLGMDTANVVARFKAEQQTLALMDHPNIANVLDAGATDTGRPFFVMEWVPGLKITDYADQHSLTISERLELFIPVCQAIQHAHQKGIIHRDIKPSNVLVSRKTELLVPKVIDFGIAKSTQGTPTGQTLFTMLERFIGTPAYMSPEQAAMSGLDIDTRADIYSLGVLLYELLTGVTPFEPALLSKCGIDEMCRIIRDTDPLRPSVRLQLMDKARLGPVAQARNTEASKLVHLVRGDLDWIVMKCLEKSRSRRYETANALASDLKRYLNTEPVIARPPSQVYRLTKLVRRNKLVFSAGSAVFLALVLGIGVSLQQSVETGKAYLRARAAELAAQKAQTRQSELRQQAEAAARSLAETLNQLELQRVEENFAAGRGSDALAILAGVLRRDPNNAPAAGRLLSALAQFTFPPPSAERLRHQGAVRSIRFSPDSSRVITASRDGTARIWGSLSGEPIGEPIENDSWFEEAQFSPDGRFAVAVSWNNAALVWDVETAKPARRPLFHGGMVNSAQFSTDSRLLVTASEDQTAQVWEVGSWRRIGHPLRHDKAVVSAKFSPNGQRVVTASKDFTARVWDSKTGEPVTPPLKHLAPVISAEFSADGKRLLTASWVAANLWDARTGAALGDPLRHDADVNAARFSPDGRYVVTASDDNTACVWDGFTGTRITGGLRHDDEVWDARFSPDGTQVVTGSRDKTVRVWDAKTGRALSDPICLWGEIRCAIFSPDGKRLAAVCGDSARVWDARAGRPAPPPLEHSDGVRLARFSPNGRLVATASHDKTVRIWDAISGNPVSKPLPHDAPVSSVEFSSDQSSLLSIAGTVADIWDVATGQRRTSVKLDGPLTCGTLSPDGHQVLTASVGGAQMWDVITGASTLGPLDEGSLVLAATFAETGKKILTASSTAVKAWTTGNGRLLSQAALNPKPTAARFSSNGQKVVGWADNKAWVWNVDTGRLCAGPLMHEGHIFSARFDSSGERVITAASDNRARVWRSKDGVPVARPLKHEGFVMDANFSPDGERVVTVSIDKTARIWDVATGLALSDPLRHNGDVNCAEFSPDGQRLVTESNDNTARIWDVPSASLPVPAWVPRIAEAIAGMRINEHDLPQPVQVSEFLLVRQQLSTSTESNVWATWATRLFSEKPR